MKKQPIVVLLVLLFVSVLAGDGFAQKWSFGPILGEAIKPTSTTISAQMDSMRAFESRYESAQAMGFFVNYRLQSLLEVHMELNYYFFSTGFMVENRLAQGWGKYKEVVVCYSANAGATHIFKAADSAGHQAF
jgi:hypothetical protein